MRVITFVLLSFAGFALAEPAVPPPRVLPKVAFTLGDFVAQTPRNAAGDFVLEIPELVNFSLSEEARAVLDSKSVEIVGQLTSASGKPRVVRGLMSCCAVHAKQYEVAVELPGATAAFGEMAWVKINGAVSFRAEDGKKVAVVTCKQLVAIEPPKNPLLR